MNTLPLPVVLRVWDALLVEGIIVLFRCAIALLYVDPNCQTIETAGVKGSRVRLFRMLFELSNELLSSLFTSHFCSRFFLPFLPSSLLSFLLCCHHCSHCLSFFLFSVVGMSVLCFVLAPLRKRLQSSVSFAVIIIAAATTTRAIVQEKIQL